MTSQYNSALSSAAQKGNLPEIERLFALGAGVDDTDDHTPLVYAAAYGFLDCTRWLLDHGADINRQRDNNNSPLHCAVSNGKTDVVKLLVERGADLNLLNGGKNALQVAVEKKNDALMQFLDRNPDQISFSWPIDNRVMQEVYHFPRRERVTLLRKCAGGDVETMQRESFASLGDVPSLREAFQEHQRRGGKLDESDVFSQVLAKPRAMLKP